MTAPIRYQSCPACAAVWALPRGLCPRCGAAPVWREASGRGAVFSVTTLHRAPARDFHSPVPYRLGLIDLAEGVRVMGRITDDAGIGARVTGAMAAFGPADIPTFTTEEVRP
ncbi:MAG: putative OB-fold protein [Paracoccaceae bacterium]|jgi:uncharacterized OB-fold protein